MILILDYYLQVSNTLRICLHPIPRIEKDFLSGFEYFPLYKKKTLSNIEKKIKILIAFGNIDSKGLTEKVIKIIIDLFSNNSIDSKKVDINIVLGKYKKKKYLIKKSISLYSNFYLYSNLEKLDKLYKSTTFAIGAPGFSHLERIEYAIPTILLSQNKIQKNLLSHWEKSKCCLVAKNKYDLKSKILILVKSKIMNNKLKKNINTKFDSEGALRIVRKIENYVKSY